MNYLFQNGELNEASQACEGLLALGFGVFETIYCFKGKAVFFEEHLDRMRAGLEKLKIPFNDLPNFEKAVSEVVKEIDEPSRLRTIISYSDGKTYSLVSTGPLTEDYESLKERGVPATLLPFPRNEFSPLCGIKCLSYAENSLGLKMAKESGFYEGIFLNLKGELCEGCRSNLFWVDNDALHTPDPRTGILPGITREKVIHLAVREGWRVKDAGNVRRCRHPIESLFNASEAFLTSSLMGVVPLTLIDGRKIGNGKPGPMTKKIMVLYKNLIQNEIS